MFSNFYQYGKIAWCCVSALEEIIALFAKAVSDSLMEVEKHNLQILLKT
jgi:hypothetical protein